jgi:hypothetical protein
LREHAIAAGVAPDFAVIEPAPAGRLLRESAEEALDGLFEERPEEMRRLLGAIDLSTYDDGSHPDLAQALIDVLEAMRVSGVRKIATPVRDASLFARARELARVAAIGPMECMDQSCASGRYISLECLRARRRRRILKRLRSM